MSPTIYSLVFKLGFLAVFISSVLVIVNAVLSAKEMGGTLGQWLKKIAAGTIVDTILIFTYFLLERGSKGVLDDEQIKLFFLVVGIFGSVLLILGYVQVYRVTKKLKLFTV
jgi:hypothetical protein